MDVDGTSPMVSLHLGNARRSPIGGAMPAKTGSSYNYNYCW